MRVAALREEKADAEARRDRVDGVVDVTGAAVPSAADSATASAPLVSLSAPDFQVLHQFLRQLFVAPNRLAPTVFGLAEQLREFLHGKTHRDTLMALVKGTHAETVHAF